MLLNNNSQSTIQPTVTETATSTNNTQTHDWQEKIASKFQMERDCIEKIYASDGDNLTLIFDSKLLPKSAAAATQEIAKLISAGRQAAQLDETDTDFSVIRKECANYGVLNSSNFTKYLKSMNRSFPIRGKSRYQSVFVTAPGFSEAIELAKKYSGMSDR